MKKAIFTKQFTASFTTETYDRIKTITDQEKISMGEWLRLAADEKLAINESRKHYKRRNYK
jgi:hypothetical protein